MNRQKSFENKNATLYVVPTPIGNLNEISKRTINVLNEVDVIACEDTRTSGKLLSYFNIHTKTIAHHMHNEQQSCKGILSLLNEGKNIALISDAGYPLISDPGQILVNEVVNNGYNVVSLSGSNAALNALVVSGIMTQPFTFYGFLDSNDSKKEKQLLELKEHPFTLVFYEAPHRITKTLKLILKVFGNRKISIARELTKKHEEIIRGCVEEVIEISDELKGEMVIVVEGYSPIEIKLDDTEIIALVDELISKGSSTKDAIKKVAKDNNLKKNDVYEIYHK